ncbi:MAG: Gfo/Idh/MocA family oxidoreductase [Salana multivorans]|uniref:Gfo/Idh/MocA family protein n=1 Tax=Salana multivorans TaxID=120377 RepID=UPI00095997D1|nr:Gfo/Idh/MocA family oxidoreductase [Salana multivorans]MBN8881546.1 Gfo/Idh/MocA family oxidoreductase [Salana multivorans]OJX97704.1 MAG: oxidoreductase [Micrococcales bacterium 73-15]
MTVSEGAAYRPQPMPRPTVEPGELVVAAAHLDHGHIYGMIEGLLGAGATLGWVYDPDPAKVAAFVERFPQARVARSEAEILDDDAVRLVAGAAVTSERAPFGVRVMDAGKDYFTDKAPLVSLDQLDDVRAAVARTGRRYAVYYSERIHVEAAVLAGQLVERGAIGRVVQVMSMGPHRVGDPATRPDWFFERASYGGILCDIGSHNFEQILHYTGSRDAELVGSTIANYHHPDHPQLDDFGDAHVVTDNGATGYVRVDWLTPRGLGTWGDGRTFLLGTDGYIELRKYVNVATERSGGHVFLVDGDGEHHLRADGTVGFPFFGQLARDVLDRTETAMTQEHALKAAELSVRAQILARDLTPGPDRG